MPSVYLSYIPGVEEQKTLPIGLQAYLASYNLGPLSNGWSLFYQIHEHHLDWEAGVKLARSLGHRHLEVTCPGILPPIMWYKEKVITFLTDAIEMLIISRMETYQAPKGWTGSIQIGPDKEQRVWTEERFGLLRWEGLDIKTQPCDTVRSD